MQSSLYPRIPFDLDGYVHQIQNRPCFICEMVAGRLNGNTLVYQDERIIVFLNKYPLLVGYTLLAPIQHKEHVTADFTLEEYLRLQKDLYRVSEAVRRSFRTERLYLLSLGSQQGNRHLHWHIAPLPPGVPFQQQQLAALSIENGILDIPPDDMLAFANRIRQAILEIRQEDEP